VAASGEASGWGCGESLASAFFFNFCSGAAVSAALAAGAVLVAGVVLGAGCDEVGAGVETGAGGTAACTVLAGLAGPFTC
jgi:hypothetical protein